MKPVPRIPVPARWISVRIPPDPSRRRSAQTFAIAIQHGRVACAAPAGWWLMGRTEREAARLLRERGGEFCEIP